MSLVLRLLLTLPAAYLAQPVHELPVSPAALSDDQSVEVEASLLRGVLEQGMPSEVATPYAAGITALRAGDFRAASAQVRRARALSYRQSVRGPTPRRLAQRHLLRTAYVEVQLSELLAIDEQLPRLVERNEERATFLQVRAMRLHNLFLAARSFTGQADPKLLRLTIAAYETSLADQSGHLRAAAQIGYAAMLGERGDLRSARIEFARLADKDVQAEEHDLPVAYYYVAIGERGRALSRLLIAARRDSWDRPGARDGSTVRGQAYKMNDFDRLRDDPRFYELVSQPEEQGAQGL